MFLGTHALRLDEKGRLFLPVKWREQLSAERPEGLVMAKGQERCVYVYPETEFTRISEILRTASTTSKVIRDYSRVFFSGAANENPDRQGRVTVAPQLRQYAGLDRDCTVIGANTRMEIWDTATWENYLAACEPAFSDLTEEVVPGVF